MASSEREREFTSAKNELNLTILMNFTDNSDNA